MDRRTFHKQISALTLGAAFLVPTTAMAMPQEQRKSALPFQLSVMLWTVFRELPFDDRLQKIADAGYSNIELTGEFRNWTDDDYARINAKRKSLGISFDATSGVRRGIGNPQDRDALLADIKSILPIMGRLDCPSLILLSGNVVPGLSRDDQHQSCIDSLKAAVALVEGKKINGQPVKLIVENIDPEENPKYYLTSVAEGFEIMKAVDHPQVRFLYDMYHDQIAEGNLIEKLEKNLPYVAVIHVADVPGRHAPGTGEINYVNIFRKLVELKYDGILAMEFRPTGDPVAALRAAREMVLAAL